MKLHSTLTGIALLVFTSANIFAQQLNPYGHFIAVNNANSDHAMNTSGKGMKVEIDKLVLNGNAAFKTAQGYITLSGEDEYVSIVRIYSKAGQEIFSRTFGQTINFAMSSNNAFCAFYDGKQVCRIRFSDNTVSTFAGASVFAINDAGDIAAYDEANDALIFRNERMNCNEAVYKIVFFKGQALFITRTDILRMKNNTLETVFTSARGRIFDTGIFGDELFVSVKKEAAEEFIFNSFATKDLQVFLSKEEVHFPLTSFTNKKTGDPSAQNKVLPSTLTNESIVDPLYYFSTNVYQPVGNTYDEMQEYSPGAIYPHPGVDLLGTFMQNVYSVKKGYVKAVLTTSAQYHWRIAIANQNTANYVQGYMYAHLEQSSIPYTVGDSVNPGDMIGYLVNFPVTGFVHCHFARVADQGVNWSAGDWVTYDNPLLYMTNILDSIAPTFEQTINNDEFAFRDAGGNYLQPDSLYGNVKVISKVYDRINEVWHCDVNKLRYSVSPLTSPTTMLLDSFAYEYSFYNDFYFTGPYYYGLLRTIYSRDQTCFTTADYNVRDFYHIVTNSTGDDSISGADSLQLFNTLNLPNASYIFRIIASDPAGNTTRDSMIIEIKNGGSGLNEYADDAQINIFPNPASDLLSIHITDLTMDAEVKVYDALGREVMDTQMKNEFLKLDISKWPAGMYNIIVSRGIKSFVKRIVKTDG